MTKQQEGAIARIKKYVLENDCFHNDPDYEIKRFEISETEYGTVWVSSVAGLKNDEGTHAELYCRNRRHIAIGKRGGLRAFKNDDGKILKGWSDVMIFGYSH